MIKFKNDSQYRFTMLSEVVQMNVDVSDEGELRSISFNGGNHHSLDIEVSFDSEALVNYVTLYIDGVPYLRFNQSAVHFSHFRNSRKKFLYVIKDAIANKRKLYFGLIRKIREDDGVEIEHFDNHYCVTTHINDLPIWSHHHTRVETTTGSLPKHICSN